MSAIGIVISGACGRMGRRIALLALEDASFTIKAALEAPGSPSIGEDYARILERALKNVTISAAPADVLGKSDVLIEFSHPTAVLAHLKEAAKIGSKVVIGTTGFLQKDIAEVKETAKKIPIVFSPNMSISVNLFFKVVGDIARVLTGESHATITEAHHVHKKDAPSGTAKELARIIKETMRLNDVPVTSIRKDEIVGDHTVVFDGPFDTFSLTHHAKTRDIFAQGALTAAKFVDGKEKGFYTMRDVLGL